MQEPFALPKLRLVLEGLSAGEEALAQQRALPDELRQPGFRRMQAAVSKGGYDASTHTVTMSVSSDLPIARYGGFEVLSHAKGAIDTSRLDAGIPYLFNHDWDSHLGRSQAYELKPHNLYVTNRFGTNPLAKEKEQDVADEILVDVSLAYWPLEVVVTEDKNGVPTYELTKWLPYETSSVTVPADFSVGVGRSAQAAAPAEVLVTYRKLAEPAPDVSATRSSENADEDEEDDDSPEDGEERSATPAASSAATPPQPEAQSTEKRTPPAMATAAVITEPQQDHAKRVADLKGLRSANPNHYTADQFADDVANGTSARDAKDAIAERIIAGAQNSNVRSAADAVVGDMSTKEQRQYSRAGAARAAINQLRPDTFTGTEAGFAREVSDSIRKEAVARGVSNLGNGILTPGVLNSRFAAMEGEKRTVMSGSGTIAGATNFTEVILPPIELLRNQAVTMRLGARMIPGLHGTPQFTRQNAAASSSWLAEGVAVAPTDPGLNFFQMAPHRLSMASAYTRDFLALSNLAIDAFLAEDRYEVLALSLDYAALAGSGTGNVPLGLLNYTGLPTVLTGSTRSNSGVLTAGAGGTQPTFVDVNAAEAAIAGVNASTLGIPRWAGTPQSRAMMRSILQFPGVNGSAPLMPNSKIGGDGMQEGPLGYDGLFSNQLPKNGTVNSVNNLHALVLGIWSQMLIGDWDLNEIIADNITGVASATYKIFEHGYYDINFRHIEAFVWMWVLAQ